MGQGSIGPVVETTAGVAAINQTIFWQQTEVDVGNVENLTLSPYGAASFTLADFSSDGGAADAALLQAAIDSMIGAGNSVVSFNDGSFTITLLWSDLGNNATPSSDSSFQPIVTTVGSTAGTSEVQTIPQPNATGGTFTVVWTAEATIALDYNIGVVDLQTALNALSDITAAGGVVVNGTDGGPWAVAWNNTGPRSLLTADGSALTNKSGPPRGSLLLMGVG